MDPPSPTPHTPGSPRRTAPTLSPALAPTKSPIQLDAWRLRKPRRPSSSRVHAKSIDACVCGKCDFHSTLIDTDSIAVDGWTWKRKASFLVDPRDAHSVVHIYDWGSADDTEIACPKTGARVSNGFTALFRLGGVNFFVQARTTKKWGVAYIAAALGERGNVLWMEASHDLDLVVARRLPRCHALHARPKHVKALRAFGLLVPDVAHAFSP